MTEKMFLKAIGFSFVIGGLLMLCSFTFQPSYGCGSNAVEVTTKSVRGHEYVIAIGTTNSSYGGTAIAFVHAESCYCKRK